MWSGLFQDAGGRVKGVMTLSSLKICKGKTSSSTARLKSTFKSMGNQPRLPRYYAVSFRESQCRWAAQHLASGSVTSFAFGAANVSVSHGLCHGCRADRAESALRHVAVHHTSRCSFRHQSLASPRLYGYGHVDVDSRRLLRKARDLTSKSGSDGVHPATWNNLVVR